jgi:signal peptidase I
MNHKHGNVSFGKRGNFLARFWGFLKEDTWQSWLVSLILAFVIIKFIFFPVLSFAMGTPLPLVVVESCSMYHSTDFDGWWESNAVWYDRKDITKGDFEDFPFSGGLSKGDIILVSGWGGHEVGDVIVFESQFRFPLIHRVVEINPVVGTKGDNNFNQLPQEREISEEEILGKSLVRVPGLGWVKLIFFEGSRPSDQRGFCK